MNHLKISTRVAMLATVLTLLLTALGLLALMGINNSNAALKTVYEDRTVALAQLAEVQANFLSNQMLLFQGISDPTSGRISQNIAAMAAHSASLEKVSCTPWMPCLP